MGNGLFLPGRRREVGVAGGSMWATHGVCLSLQLYYLVWGILDYSVISNCDSPQSPGLSALSLSW